MNIPAPIIKTAWLPLTPRGVAMFAGARTSRLLFVQLVVALIAAGSLGWLLKTAWAPPIRAAIAQLPEGARLSNGILEWPAESPKLLAEGHFLGLILDVDHSGKITCVSHVTVEFGRTDWQVSSLLGVLAPPEGWDTRYQRDWTLPLTRKELEPWWGAREPFLIALAMAAVVVSLLVSWAVLATLYMVPAWLSGFYANRSLNWAGSWKLAGASLMPGALLLSAAIILYGMQAFDLVKLGLAFGLHFVAGWIYILVSPLFLPRNPAVPQMGKNPFGASSKR
jgi:hypothetical protein